MASFGASGQHCGRTARVRRGGWLVAGSEWDASATVSLDGARLTVTSQDQGEVDRIRGSGFIGLMATGQAHHLAIIRGHAVHPEKWRVGP